MHPCSQWECLAFKPMAVFVFAPFSGQEQKSPITLHRASSPHSSHKCCVACVTSQSPQLSSLWELSVPPAAICTVFTLASCLGQIPFLRQRPPLYKTGCFNPTPQHTARPPSFLKRGGAVSVMDLGVPCLKWGSLLSGNFFCDLPCYNNFSFYIFNKKFFMHFC